MKYFIALLLISASMASCCKVQNRRTYVCEITHLANGRGVQYYDTLYNMSKYDIDTLERGAYINNDSIQHIVHCQ